jgi:hypothetical protein
MRLWVAVALILAVYLGIQTAMERRGAGAAAKSKAVATVMAPAPKPVVPASSRTWRRGWVYPAGAPLSGAPVGLDDGWVVTTGKGRIIALDVGGRERWSR